MPKGSTARRALQRRDAESVAEAQSVGHDRRSWWIGLGNPRRMIPGRKREKKCPSFARIDRLKPVPPKARTLPMCSLRLTLRSQRLCVEMHFSQYATLCHNLE